MAVFNNLLKIFKNFYLNCTCHWCLSLHNVNNRVRHRGDNWTDQSIMLVNKLRVSGA